MWNITTITIDNIDIIIRNIDIKLQALTKATATTTTTATTTITDCGEYIIKQTKNCDVKQPAILWLEK